MGTIIKLLLFISLIAIIGACAVFFNIIEFGGGGSDTDDNGSGDGGSVGEPRTLAPIRASYRIIFDALWSSDNGHTIIPEGAHFSPFVAWTHKKDASMFEVGERASSGIEILAETGDTSSFIKELERQKQIGNVGEYVVGDMLDTPGTLEKNLSVSQKYKFVSVISMLAPSPDWFVAVRDIELFAENEWEQEHKNLPTVVYDSGTDGGESFDAEDIDTEHIIELLDQEVADVKQGGGEIARISVIKNDDED